MKKYLLVFLLLFVSTPALANTSGYAWSESVGWFDFTNVVVTDSAVTGFAYNDNTGWLSFATSTTVVNSNGDLSGYAWSESVGWFDFENVTITSGAFGGYAYNDNTGWLSFDDGTDVTTEWRPPAGTSDPEPAPRRSSSGSRRVVPPALSQTPNLPSATPVTTAPISTGIRNLKLGDSGNDVKSLQIILNLLGYTVAPSGVGSQGNETTLFGPLTQQALIRYQIENNITPAVGYFGPITQQSIITKLITLLLTSS